MADTPQIEVPIASSEPSLPDKPECARSDEDDGSRDRHVHQDLDQTGGAQFGDVAENEARAQRDDPDFEPELVCLYTGPKYPVQTDGVGDEKPNHDGPQHVFDIGHPPVFVLGQRVPPDLGVFTQQTHGDQQQNSRYIVQWLPAGEGGLFQRCFVGLDASGAHAITTESSGAHWLPPMR